jgi:hypothetical protein
MQKIHLLAAFSFLIPQLATSAVLESGETLRYNLRWKKGIAVIKAGTLTTQIQSNNGTRLELKATAVSTKVVDAFYPIRYNVTSLLNTKVGGSERFEMHGTEHKEKKDQTEIFNYASRTGQFAMKVTKTEDGTSRVTKDKNETYSLSSPVADVFSILYQVRAAELPRQIGGKIQFNIVYEGEVWTSTFERVETTSQVLAGQEVPTGIYRLTSVSPKEERNDSTYLWIAEDEHRTLTKVESEIKIGKIQLILKSASYLGDANLAE